LKQKIEVVSNKFSLVCKKIKNWLEIIINKEDVDQTEFQNIIEFQKFKQLLPYWNIEEGIIDHISKKIQKVSCHQNFGVLRKTWPIINYAKIIKYVLIQVTQNYHKYLKC